MYLTFYDNELTMCEQTQASQLLYCVYFSFFAEPSEFSECT